ncbi:MAG: type II toxin-antitoxin system HicB family antitoxin [Candidatus Blackburnbacteria bacterium]|nr:type II toxin-antitoxin system HicB family antitoxin [Candidatus Blackburnbacteria bacterium]
MEQKVANYTVVIEKEKRTGTNTTCYTAYVPILGIATEADTIEQVEKEIKSLIQFHINCLAQERERVPIEAENSLVTKTRVELPNNAIIAY